MMRIPEEKELEKRPPVPLEPEKPPVENESDFLDDIDETIKQAKEYQKRDEKEGE